jgi:hypothetical protein
MHAEAAETATWSGGNPAEGRAGDQCASIASQIFFPAVYKCARGSPYSTIPLASHLAANYASQARNSPLPARSVPLVFNGNNSSRFDIHMRRVRAYCVRGEVRDATGTLASSVAINVSQALWSASVLNYGGRFLMANLIPGDYEIDIMDRPGIAGRVLTRRNVTVRAANINHLVITIPGRCHGSGPLGPLNKLSL